MSAAIANYMTEHVHSIRPDETLKTAHDMMKRLKIRHLPVIEGKRVIGLVTDRDLSLVHLYPDMNLEKSRVDELMLQDVYVVKPTTHIKDVVREMGQKKFGSVIVIDRDDKLVGIFTATDALNLLHKIYDIDTDI
jgi:acetoin utilization protein AcuB